MSNSLIPMSGPSQKDISEMARLRDILNGNVPAVPAPIQAEYSGGYAGTQRPLHESRQAPPAAPYMPSFGTSREEVDAMKNILTKLNTLSGDEPQAPTRASAPALTEASHYAAPALTNAGPFQVLVMIEESNGKEVNRFSVVDANRRDVVPSLVIKEAATAIMKLMNKGQGLESAKVQEILELEEDYNRNRIETGKHRARYTRSTELGEHSAANVFKERFNVAKANALAAQDQIKSILESIR